MIQDISIAEWYIPSSLSVTDLVEDMQKSAWKEMDKWAAEVSATVKEVEKMVVRGVPFVEIIRTAKEKQRGLDRDRYARQDRDRPHAFRQHCGKGGAQGTLPGAYGPGRGREFKMP